MAASSPSNETSSLKKDKSQSIFVPSVKNVIRHISTSGIAVSVATGVTHPLDVVKVRLQMESMGRRAALTGMGSMFVRLVKHEGLLTLYSGLMPALARSLIYGGLRIGLYEPCKYSSDVIFGETNILTKIASGMLSGSIATAVTNPTEVLKVRLQMNSLLASSGMISQLYEIVSKEGVTSLWKGVGPAMARAAALTASQLVTYDESKQVLLHLTPLREGFFLHLSASMIAGVMGTIITAPVDTVKTRLMMQRESLITATYKNGFHCAYMIVQTEGPQALYKGSTALFARLGPQTAITFIVYEKARALVGMKAL